MLTSNVMCVLLVKSRTGRTNVKSFRISQVLYMKLLTRIWKFKVSCYIVKRWRTWKIFVCQQPFDPTLESMTSCCLRPWTIIPRTMNIHIFVEAFIMYENYCQSFTRVPFLHFFYNLSLKAFSVYCRQSFNASLNIF